MVQSLLSVWKVGVHLEVNMPRTATSAVLEKVEITGDVAVITVLLTSPVVVTSEENANIPLLDVCVRGGRLTLDWSPSTTYLDESLEAVDNVQSTVPPINHQDVVAMEAPTEPAAEVERMVMEAVDNVQSTVSPLDNQDVVAMEVPTEPAAEVERTVMLTMDESLEANDKVLSTVPLLDHQDIVAMEAPTEPAAEAEQTVMHLDGSRSTPSRPAIVQHPLVKSVRLRCRRCYQNGKLRKGTSFACGTCKDSKGRKIGLCPAPCYNEWHDKSLQ